MGSNLNGFGSTVTYTARSQIGEAIMHFGGNAAATPNDDTTVGVAAQAVQKSHEAWLNAQLAVTLTNDIQMKKYNISEGTSVDNVTPALAQKDRQLINLWVAQDNAGATFGNSAVYENHPVWSSITEIAPANILDINGYIHNASETFKTVLAPSNALLNAYQSNVTITADTNPGHTINIGGRVVVNG